MSGRIELTQAWRLRNAAATALALSEEQMCHAVADASVEQLVALIETFSPARSAGPDWTRSFEPLVERLWAWCDDARMATLADTFRARGIPWMAVANALSPEQGARLRGDLRQPAWARLPAFAVA
jgi:hypothetical protein